MAVHIVKLKATNRDQLGSRSVKRLRDKGLLPGVIYGHKQAVLPVTLDQKEVTNHINKGAHLFDIDLAGVSETVLVKDAQYDYLGIELLHVDFSRVRLDEKVKVTVPLELKGTPVGEANGQKLQVLLTDLEVECVVLNIPEVIRFSVAAMEEDSTLHIKDIPLPEGVRSLQDGELIVAMVREVKEEVVAPVAVEAAAAEPEVIGQKEKEEKATAEAATGAAKGGEKK
jgi:large subunit ribosomal protein L25